MSITLFMIGLLVVSLLLAISVDRKAPKCPTCGRNYYG